MAIQSNPTRVTFFIITSLALMMEAASTTETMVNLYQTTQRNNPEDSHLHTHRCENLNLTLITIVK
jgi:hypothetical protein